MIYISKLNNTTLDEKAEKIKKQDYYVNMTPMNAIKVMTTTTTKISNNKKRPFEELGVLDGKTTTKTFDSSNSSSSISKPPLYDEDLGLDGIKTKQKQHHATTTTNSSSYSMNSIHMSMKLTKEDVIKLRERKSRFGTQTNAIANHHRNDKTETITAKPDPLLKPLSAGRVSNNNNADMKAKYERLVGTNMNLEKDFLRLTTFPKKEDVRPLEVLIKSLAHIKYKYLQDEDFDWVNNQLKSVRQDIVCQGIRNKFVLDVYETHARILLEHGDLNEFNQCQTMIRSLTEKSTDDVLDCIDDDTVYRQPIERYDHNDSESNKAPLQQSYEALLEFRSYALLYALVRNSRVELRRELDRMKDFLGTGNNNKNSKNKAKKNSDAPQQHQHHESCCDHAIQVVNAVEECNYRTFFKLYGSAPHMSAYLMDFLVKRIRDQAYERIIAAYRPTVSVEHIRECLCLDDLEQTRRFLKHRNAAFIQEQGGPPFWVDCKASK